MTLQAHYSRMALIAAACLSLAACPETPEPKPAATGGYEGLVAFDGIAVTENRCVFSILYSDFEVERPSAAPADPIQKSRSFTLRGLAHIAGAPVNVMLHGAYLGGPGLIANVMLEYGAEKVAQDFSLAEGTDSGNILLELAPKALEGANIVKISVTLPATATPTVQQTVQIDSIDLTVTGEFCKNAK